MDYYTKTTTKCLEELQSSPRGLSATEVNERQREYGLNAIIVKGEPLWKKIIEPFADIFMLVLFVAAAMSLWHGEHIDAAIIAAIIMISAVIYYVQRFSTERILKSLQRKTNDRTNVMRDGAVVQLDTTQLVPGDVIVLDEGEKVPADCRLLETASLRVDESQLTGESMPINKQTEPIAEDRELYERTNMVYQGSFIIGGQATALVVGTGNATEFGKLAVLSTGKSDESPVQRRIANLIAVLVKVIAAISFVAFALSLYRGMDVAEATRYVLALAVSAVPESLPIAITVILVLGMRRMAKKKALVKSPEAIETIGIVTAIASDKTGTLTKNMLTVQQIWSHEPNERDILESIARSLLPASSKTRDPLDVAMESYVPAAKRVPAKGIAGALPFDQLMAMSGNIWGTSGDYTLWIKGSPEQVIERSELSAYEREVAHNQVKSMAANGLRVLALAHIKTSTIIGGFDELPKKGRLTFGGLIGVADELRPEAHAAITRAHRAGIRVCMVTGDHFETAFHIGRQLGIATTRDEVFDCRKMHEMTDEELEKVVQNIRVFSRVIPEDKHRLLVLLKRSQIVAMTGDGVNDVPALTGAHVGIAMGGGTGIAKDAGDIILIDNNFRSIVNAVHEGRTVYANIKRMVAYLLSTNAGEVLVALGALIAGIPIPVIAVQVLWVNLVTDTCMVIPLGLEPGEKRNMLKPPQKPNAPLFSRFMLSRMALTASTMAALTLGIYAVFLGQHSVDYARAIAFNALVVMQWASAINSRSDYEPLYKRIRKPNWPFYAGLAIAVLCQVVAMAGPLHDALHIYAIPSMPDLIATSAIAFFAPIIIIELHKWVGRKYFSKGTR